MPNSESRLQDGKKSLPYPKNPDGGRRRTRTRTRTRWGKREKPDFKKKKRREKGGRVNYR